MFEINRSCTPELAKSLREVFDKRGMVEGKDFIDHTKGGTSFYSEEEMAEFKEELRCRARGEPGPSRQASEREVILAYQTFHRNRRLMAEAILLLLLGAVVIGLGWAIALGWSPWT